MSLAWPGTVLILVLVLRAPISRLLAALARLKYKDLELDFGREVAQAQIEVGQARVEVDAKTNTKRDSVAKRVAAKAEEGYLADLALVSPRAAVLEAWLPFEVTLSHVSQQLGFMAEGKSPLQMADLIAALVSRTILTFEEASAVNRLWHVRNKVVHAEAVVLQPADVVEFARILAGVGQAMERRATEVSGGAAQREDAADEVADG